MPAEPRESADFQYVHLKRRGGRCCPSVFFTEAGSFDSDA